MTDRFATTLDCADTGFLPDGLLDELPLPSPAGPCRIAGLDLNKPRIPAALSAALALAPAPGGFTVADHAAKVRAMPGHQGSAPCPGTRATPTQQAACDLRKLRGKQLIDKPGRTRRYHVPPDAARIITALLALRDHVIAPILAGVRSRFAAPAWAASPRSGPPSTVTMRPSGSACRPCSGTSASRPSQPPHRQHFVDRKIQATRSLELAVGPRRGYRTGGPGARARDSSVGRGGSRGA